MAESVKPSVVKQVAKAALKYGGPWFEVLDFFINTKSLNVGEAKLLEEIRRSERQNKRQEPRDLDKTIWRVLNMDIPPKDAKAKGGKVKKVMKEYKKGKLKPVRKRKQAIAIALSSSRKRKKK